MKVELIGTYPMWNNPKTGCCQATCHVYLAEVGVDSKGKAINVDLRGVRVYRRRAGVFDIKWPCNSNLDLETRQCATFPTWNFLDDAQNKDLKAEIAQLLAEDWKNVKLDNLPTSFRAWMKMLYKANGKANKNKAVPRKKNHKATKVVATQPEQLQESLPKKKIETSMNEVKKAPGS